MKAVRTNKKKTVLTILETLLTATDFNLYSNSLRKVKLGFSQNPDPTGSDPAHQHSGMLINPASGGLSTLDEPASTHPYPQSLFSFGKC